MTGRKIRTGPAAAGMPASVPAEVKKISYHRISIEKAMNPAESFTRTVNTPAASGKADGCPVFALVSDDRHQVKTEENEEGDQ